MHETRQFRGISKRLAIHYLEGLGGTRVDDAGDRVEGDGWSAALSAEKVDVAGSISLTEVTVEFDGDADRLEPVVERFEQKAVRAGG